MIYRLFIGHYETDKILTTIITYFRSVQDVNEKADIRLHKYFSFKNKVEKQKDPLI